ncbi:MAG: hypothetical protein ABI629_07920 [bacterium]
MNVLDYRHNPTLGGSLSHMRDPRTQTNWDTVLKAFSGVALSESELAWFRVHTGRTTVLPNGYAELVGITGRQSGKDDTIADTGNARAVQTIINNEDVDGLHIIGVAQDHRSSIRTMFHRLSRPWLRIPELAKHVVARTTDSLTLSNGLTLAVYPCRPAAVRGLRCLLASMNEVAHYRDSADNPIGIEMRRALTPTIATTGGKIIIVSSPSTSTDLLGDLHRRHWGRDDSSTLVVQASAPEMNPTLPADYLERMKADDPEGYRSEVLGEFKQGVSTFFEATALEACTRDRRELPPVAGIKYAGHWDASGGRNDAAAASAGHGREGVSVVDAVRAWPAPHDPRAVIAEAAAFFKSYGITTIQSDRYAGEFPVSEFATHGIRCEMCPLDRSALYLGMLPRVLSGLVELPNDPVTLRELRGLERRRGFAGKDRVDHRGGAHDDRAVVVAGVVYATAGKPALRHGGEATRVGGLAPADGWRRYRKPDDSKVSRIGGI